MDTPKAEALVTLTASNGTTLVITLQNYEALISGWSGFFREAMLVNEYPAARDLSDKLWAFLTDAKRAELASDALHEEGLIRSACAE